MIKNQEISWRPPGNGPRLFGRFVGYTPDGKVRVARGAAVHTLDYAEITWEVG